jgi:hypothetical protein
MNTSERNEQLPNIGLLSTMMKIQAIVWLVYGITFFFIPTFTLKTFYGFDQLPPLFWLRFIGSMSLAITLGEYLCVRRLSERLDLAWFFFVLPALLVLSLIWERAAGRYIGSGFFFWSSIVVTGFFTVAIGLSRLRVKNT